MNITFMEIFKLEYNTMLLKLIYYRFYKFSEAISFGLSNPEFKAAAIVAFAAFMNSITIYQYSTDEPISEKWILIVIYAALFIMFLTVFLNKKLKIESLEYYRKVPTWSNIISNIVILFYLISSFVFFVKSMTV